MEKSPVEHGYIWRHNSSSENYLCYLVLYKIPDHSKGLAAITQNSLSACSRILREMIFRGNDSEELLRASEERTFMCSAVDFTNKIFTGIVNLSSGIRFSRFVPK